MNILGVLQPNPDVIFPQAKTVEAALRAAGPLLWKVGAQGGDWMMTGCVG